MHSKLSLKARRELLKEFLQNVINELDGIDKNEDFNKLIKVLPPLLKNYAQRD